LFAKFEHVVDIVLFRELAGEEPALQTADLEAIEVAQGLPDECRGRVRTWTEPVPRQHLQGFGRVLVNHGSQGIMRRLIVRGGLMADERDQQGDDVLTKSAEMVGSALGSAANTVSQAAGTAASTTASAAQSAGAAAERVTAPTRRAVKRTAKRVVKSARRMPKVAARRATKATARKKKPVVKARKASRSTTRGKKKAAGGRKKK